jgi:signal transduction histidine kinase
MLDRLEAGGARQRAFVADAAHELRSPLAVLRTVLEVALVHPDPDGPEATLATACEEVLRMTRLVDDLLLLARLDAGAPTTRAGGRAQEVDLAEVVRELVPDGVVLDLAPARVVADPDALVRVVRNLVDNALRHAMRTVHVTVRPGEPVELLVDDDGPGIPDSERERVFDRFHRLDTPRTRDAGGSGLGLAIVRELVAAAGGTVVVERAPAGGARLRVRLPAVAR